MKKYYGNYGGAFIPESLSPILDELEQAFEKYFPTKEFQDELKYHFKHFVGRETPLTYLENISNHLGGAKIFVKREDMTCIGAHKINHSLVQAMLAKRMGKKILICETGAGMHGVSVATVGAKFGFKVKVFMGKIDMERQMPNVERIKMLGAEVVCVKSGNQTLKDAVDESLSYFISNAKDTYYLLGSALGPYPYPQIVRKSQEVVGKEAKKQFKKMTEGSLPDFVIACVGGGSNAIGLFSAFLKDKGVKIIGVEGGGTDIKQIGKHAARIKGAGSKEGTFHGYKSIFIQKDNGDIAPTSSISAGLDYPGIGPEHAFLSDIKRVEYEYAYDNDVIKAFKLTSLMEGILPALESSHALSHAFKIAPTLGKDKTILVNLSGRGDKDLHTILNYG